MENWIQSVPPVAAVIALALVIWRASARWTLLEQRVNDLWAEHLAMGRLKLKQRGVLVENSPVSLGDAVNEAIGKGIREDFLKFYRDRRVRKLPKHDQDLWREIVKGLGMDNLVARADELGWGFDEYKAWWIEAFHNPEIVDDALRKAGR